MRTLRFSDIKALVLVCFAMLGMAYQNAETTKDPFRDSMNNAVQRDIVGDIQTTMQSSPYLRRVYPLIFREGETEARVAELDQDFGAWEGKIIGKIRVIQSDVFMISEALESIPFYLTVLRFGNRLQPKSSLKRIERNLFFAEGDSLNPDFLIANLHYLYDLGLYSELEFDLRDMADSKAGIDLTIREKFFLQFSAKYIEDDELRIRIMNRNFLGFGQSLIFTGFVDPKNSEISGWESSYTHPNILNTFVKGDFHYLDLKDNELLELGLMRDFLYPLYVNFGGVNVGSSKSMFLPEQHAVHKHEAGAWYARIFGAAKYPHYFYSSASVQARKHQQRPPGMAWQDALLTLSSVGYAGSEYRYVSGLSSFLDSDYVPMGKFVQALAGYEFGDNRNRPFLGLHAAGAWFGSDRDYIYGQLYLDSFFHSGKPEQTFLAFEPVYISPMKSIGVFEGRSLINARLVKSWKSLPTQKVRLSDDLFFRDGLGLQGSDIFSLGMEEDVNTPYQVFGFQISAFAFLDLAVVDGDEGKLKNRNSLFSQGLGLRLRNPSLIWDFIELRGAVQFLNSDQPTLAFALNVKPTRILSDFRGRRPQPYNY